MPTEMRVLRGWLLVRSRSVRWAVAVLGLTLLAVIQISWYRFGASDDWNTSGLSSGRHHSQPLEHIPPSLINLELLRTTMKSKKIVGRRPEQDQPELKLNKAEDTNTKMLEEELQTLLASTDGAYGCASRVLVGSRCFCKLGEEHVHSWKDGAKMVCLDHLPAGKECRVLSFGIDNDFSFDLGMQDLGCSVHSFDPTMNVSDHRHSQGVFFHNAGLSASDSAPHTSRLSDSGTAYRLLSLDTAALAAGWSDGLIDYLKLDVESSEWPALSQQLLSPNSTLHRVRQLQIELHLQAWQPAISSAYTRLLDEQMVPHFLALLRRLTAAGFRLVYTHPYYHCKKLDSGKCLSYLYDTHWLNINTLW